MEAKKEIKKEFVTIKIKRTAEGIEIFVKSPKLEDFFASIHKIGGYSESDHVTSQNFPGLKAYRGGHFTEIKERCKIILDKWGDFSIFFGYDYPNLSFVRTVGVRDGVKLVYKGVYSLQAIETFIAKAKEGLQKLYVQYMKPVDIEFVISTREEV